MADDRTYRYSAVFEPADEGGYVVHIPTLGIATEGDTLDEAREMAEDAVRCYVEGCLQDGEEVPVEREDAMLTSIAVHVRAVARA
jgi:antitoxin HicB